ncbi:MAG: hypothetical protein P1U58_02645 [Verrucomicrobiales bacterium]|nr:hypothetical protein [Verrucomicrobiales bacterium]
MKYQAVIWLALLAATFFCEAGGKKTKGLVVTFHTEAEQTDSPKFITPVKLGSEHRQYFFSKIPSFTDKDIAWFYPFTAADGISFGAAFRLNERAASELRDITIANQGSLLGLRCSDAPVKAVLIDRPISDGIVVVWDGLQQRHLQEFRAKFPHVDDVAPDSGPEFAMPQR